MLTLTPAEQRTLLENDRVFKISNSENCVSASQLSQLASEKKREDILIVTSISEESPTTGKDKELLQKILLAVHLQMEDVCSINLSTEQILPFTSIEQALNTKTILCFGVPPKLLRLNFSTRITGIVQFAKVTLLFGPALNQLNNDMHAKKSFWALLQQVFNKT